MAPLFFRWLSAVCGLAALALHAVEGPKLTASDLDFFEKRIRPILTDHCYKCHSAGSEKLKGGLLLDTRDGVLKGGATGPAVVPGNLEKSLLIQAVRYQDKDLQMPPNDKKLADNQIADLEQWVRMGAPDPRTESTTGAHLYALDMAKGKKHWAFQPVSNPPVPTVDDDKHWAQNAIDPFILAKLVEKKLTPSAKADKVTLIRRATFDLIGIPPTTKEVDDFEADDSAEAFSKVIDRLLASPHYGERWGRYWLDLAHYADTKGQVGGNEDNRYLHSWVYRDYVIRAFNEDLPYDQFLLQQIAADKLSPGEDKRSLAALGFLTLGNRFNNQANDIIDDRIDIIGKSTMGLTLGCARCHDHKFDPIPTRDYYALHGVFNSCVEPKEGPMIEAPKNPAAYADFKRELGTREAELDRFRAEATRQVSAEVRGRAGEYMLATVDFKSAPKGSQRNSFFQKRGLLPQLSGPWDNTLKAMERRGNPIFAPWVAFAALEEREFPARAKELAAKFYANDDKKINPIIARMLVTPPVSLKDVAARYSAVFNDVDKRWQGVMSGYEARKKMSADSGPEPSALPDPGHEEIRKFLVARNSPTYLDDQRVNNFINRDNKMRNKLATLTRDVNDLKLNHPGAPACAQVLQDSDHPQDSSVFLRGNPAQRGPVVPRHFLEVLSPETPPPFHEGSGRLELARAIASRGNPLTARVMVNRIWLHHFGEGICRNPDDFGTRSEPPTHPKLLDYLATRFMDDGWSVKKLHRLIMTSAVYQQSSDDNPRHAQIDPENRWLWQMNRRRLDFESLRDTILFIGGKLALSALGGPPVRLNSEPYSTRRSIYGLVDRNNLPNMYTAFDFASPDLTTGKRDTTVVPQQALFMMNSALVVEQARALVLRPDFRSQYSEEKRIQLLYKLIYQRAPTALELKLALTYLHSESATPAPAPTKTQESWSYGYGELDPVTKRTRFFAALPVFNNQAWMSDPQMRDPKFAGMLLTANGGLPGKSYAVIRRWTAPRDGTIAIDGTLRHPQKEGDGVIGRIVSNRLGELGAWAVFQNQAPAKVAKAMVKRGDTIDFIVECRANPKADNFAWTPTIRMSEAKEGELAEWNAQMDFSGTAATQHLEAWEKFAQVLLETNELTFVN